MNNRFFFKYQNEKDGRQVVGIHQFGKMSRLVATYLNLSNTTDYTCHCFRRSSATMLIESDEDITSLRSWADRRHQMLLRNILKRLLIRRYK